MIKLISVRISIFLVIGLLISSKPLAWGSEPAVQVVEFSGQITRGETYQKVILGGLHFQLAPESQGRGWQILIISEDRPQENLARFTPPFHFVPNPRFIEGWHFRNTDNTGPNVIGEKNVNAPQKIREFIFSPDVDRSIKWPLKKGEPELIRSHGFGILKIIELKLGNLVPGERAWIESMSFKVRLELSSEKWIE